MATKEAAIGLAEAIGGKFLSSMASVGEAAYSGIKIGGKMALGMGELTGRMINDIDPVKYHWSLFGAGLTGKGKAVVYGTALAAGSVGAVNDYKTKQMGMPSGEVTGPAPKINYTRFGEEMGATGDLVFAMNRNRRG